MDRTGPCRSPGTACTALTHEGHEHKSKTTTLRNQAENSKNLLSSLHCWNRYSGVISHDQGPPGCSGAISSTAYLSSHTLHTSLFHVAYLHSYRAWGSISSRSRQSIDVTSTAEARQVLVRCGWNIVHEASSLIPGIRAWLMLSRISVHE